MRTVHLRYITTRKAVIFGSVRAAFFNRALRLYMIVIISGMIGLGVHKDIEEGRSIGFVVFSVILQLTGIAIMICIGVMAVTALGLFLGRGKGVLGEHELILSDAGLIERTEYNESLNKWKGLGEMVETRSYYFLRVSETGGGYHLIPRREGALEGNVEEFITEFRARANKA